MVKRSLGRRLQAFAEVIGEPLAIRLSAHFGGRAVYIPHTPQPDSELVQVIGEAAAEALARRFGGLYYTVALSAGRRARIIELSRENVPVRRIARTLGCTERYVYIVRQEHRLGGGSLDPICDHQQADLFEEEAI